MGYGERQIAELGRAIADAAPQTVVSATPADLGRILDLSVPVARVTYELEEVGSPDLRTLLREFPSR
jgi:predicted GTPase